MKIETKKKRQLKEIRKWLNHSRSLFLDRSPNLLSPEFYLLVGVEQIVKYLEIDQEKTETITSIK